MFPFSLDSNINLNDYLNELKNIGWQKESYQIKYGIDYNEYVYFYPYIWDILFNRETTSEYNKNVNGVIFLKYPIPDKKAYFSVNVQTCIANWEENKYEIKKSNEVKLPLKNIFLHLFEVGVGILIFEIVHDVRFSPDKSDIYSASDYLRFMETGRRIFIPFVNGKANLENKLKINEHPIKKPKEKELSEQGNMVGLDAIRQGIAAEKIIIELGDNSIETNFLSDPFLLNKGKNYKPALSKIITYFLDADNFTYENDTYKSIIDERMFVHSYFSIGDAFTYLRKNNSEEKEITLPCANHHFLEALKKAFENGIEKQEINEAVKLWYQMIFLDWQEPSCQNPYLMKKLLNESTYVRWSNYGGFSGFSRFSSVMISNINEAGFIYNHFQSMYYQIAILLLFYRGAILNFSDRSENLSNRIHDLPSRHVHNSKEKNILNEILEEADRLNKEFLLFRNKFWFREVTAQDQGIEIFDLWSKQMRNKELMQDVESEIHTLFEFIDSLNEKNISNKINILTIIGGLFLPIAIITSFFGMNFSFLTPGAEKQSTWLVLKIQELIPFLSHRNHLTEFTLFTLLLLILLGLEYVIYKLLEKNY